MPDLDKWSSVIQTAGIIGGVIGGALLALFGRKATQKSDDSGDDQTVRAERARLLAAEAQVAEDRMRRDWEAALKATRQSFYDQSQKLTEKFEGDLKDLETRVRDLEKSRRPTSRR